MKSALRFGLITLLLASCQVGDSTTPNTTGGLSALPSFAVSDGATGGNPDFFFLPPMAKDPSTNSNYQANAFNPNLKPEVRICVLEFASNVNASTPCKSAPTFMAIAALSDGNYVYNWGVPKGGDVLYRVGVYLGEARLGFTDVSTFKSDQYVAVNDGRTLPIRFRIEQFFSRCATQSQSSCVSKTIDLSVPNTVKTTIGAGDAGVTIPGQPGGLPTTVTVQPCDNLNPRVTDLPTFGECVKVTASPALAAKLTNAATVFICDVVNSPLVNLNMGQFEYLTMHRYDAPVAGSQARFAALPPADACKAPPVVGSVTGLVREVARGAYASAGRELFAMLAPKPLYAATRRLDVGAGALTDEFSDFQFALPAKMSVAQESPSSVLVTDLAGVPVKNARVRFAATAAECAGLPVPPPTDPVSTSSGVVAAPGGSLIVACGRGLAGTDNNGPRSGVDPFQPLSTEFGDAPTGLEVPVLTGSVLVEPTTLVGFGSGFYNGYGPYLQSTTAPVGWPLNLTIPTSTTVGSQAPFLTGGCGRPANFAGPLTTFPLNRDIFVTKSVDVPVNVILEITVQIDNDLRIWLDGTELTRFIPNTTFNGAVRGTYSVAASPFWMHEDCATEGPAVLTLPDVSTGPHTIALWARDRSGDAFLDMKVVVK